MENLIQQIEPVIMGHEGSKKKNGRHIVYPCPEGYQTFGYGRNLETRGGSEAEARLFLRNDIEYALQDLGRIFPDINLIPRVWVIVMADMHHALGPGRFRKFKKMITAVKGLDKFGMIREMRDSKWYRGRGHDRIKHLIQILQEEI